MSSATEQMSVTQLSERIVRFCAATLAGIKPAGLFNCHTCLSCPQTFGCSRLTSALECVRQQIEPYGVHAEVLLSSPSGTLVYVWRTDLLLACLAHPQTTRALAHLGYDTSNISQCLSMLHNRMCAHTELKARGSSHTFPHEIGFFLGYPYEDVMGFINKGPARCICSGHWRVYHDAESARKTFAAIDRCRTRALHAWNSGATLADLASGRTQIADTCTTLATRAMQCSYGN